MAKLTKPEVGLLVGVGGVLLALWYLRKPHSEEDGIRVKRSADLTGGGRVVLETDSGSGFEEDGDPEEQEANSAYKTKEQWKKRCFAISVTGGDCTVDSAFHEAAFADLVIVGPDGAAYQSTLKVRGKKVRVSGGLWKGGQTLTHPGELSTFEAFSADGKLTLRCTRAGTLPLEVALLKCP